MTTTSRTLSLALLLTLAACSGVVATPDTTDTTDAGDPPGTTEADAGSSTTGKTVPVDLQPYDCAPARTETMGASLDSTATFQIWLDLSQLYDCHSAKTPHCRAFGGAPNVYECSTEQL